MLQKNQYWVFDKAIPERYCNHLIKYGNQKKDSLALTNGITKRDSNVVWLDDKWIYRLIHPYIHTANRNAGWNFEWDFSESCQFTKYSLNQYYDWIVTGKQH